MGDATSNRPGAGEVGGRHKASPYLMRGRMPPAPLLKTPVPFFSLLEIAPHGDATSNRPGAGREVGAGSRQPLSYAGAHAARTPSPLNRSNLVYWHAH